MAWNEYVLLGIGIAINIVGFIYNIWLMTHAASRQNAWQNGFDEGVEQGKMAEQSKHRVWADEESDGQKTKDWREQIELLNDVVERLTMENEQLVEDLHNCMYYTKPKNNNTCNFCIHDSEGERCKGKDDWMKCRPCWRGVRKEKDDE